MFIERIQVEEGFLNGIDIQFGPGLNVLIGGRGTGKTSIIELIRYCLGVEGHTDEIEKRATEHALSILQGGRVTLTVNIGNEQILVSRSSTDKQPRSGGSFQLPLIFSQTEIELLGLEHQGRLRMLDDFIAEGSPTFSSSLNSNASQARSYTSEIRALAKEIEALEEQIRELPAFRDQLKPVLEEEKGVAKVSAEVAGRQREMRDATNVSSAATVKQTVLEQLVQELAVWAQQIDAAANGAPTLDGWPEGDDVSELRKKIESQISKGAKLIEGAAREVEGVRLLAEKTLDEVARDRNKHSARLREIRNSVEALKVGAGAVAKKASDLRQRIAGLEATKKQLDARAGKMGVIKEKRAEVLDALGGLYSSRFEARGAIAKSLNKKLSPKIKITVTQAAEVSQYCASLIASLRGSSIRYNELAPHLASRVSPRELVEAVEDGNVDFIVEAAEINKDRAQRLVVQLRDSRLEEILLAEVEDSVSLQLLDGTEFKDIDGLSTGQRCTVVLPIVLQHRDRALVIDQPEDHLDNGFIVETLIKVLRERSGTAQMIVATHNANIPVLGEAERVVVLSSDGKRAFVQHNGKLDDIQSVRAITNLMEGGKEAFEARARFYKKHPSA